MTAWFDRLALWQQALCLTVGITLLLALVGFVMGKLRHLTIEGGLRRLLGVKLAIFVGYYVTIIGTLHHELSHALGYLITGGRVHKISILPKAQPDGSVRLGYVSGSTRGPMLLRAVQDTVSSAAPLLFGFVTVYLLWRFALPHAASTGLKAFVIYAIVSILLHMELSHADLKILARGIVPTLLLLYVLILLYLRFAR